MIRIVVSNQRGGVGKTTTAVTFARYLADQGHRVLLIDTDPQGSVEAALGLQAKRHLAQFVAHRYALSECVVAAHQGLDVLCSNRETLQAESAVLGAHARELVLRNLLTPSDQEYSAVVIDVAPSISMLQTCAMVYARSVLIPVDMDSLSLAGAAATISSIREINDFMGAGVRAAGLLPTRVDQRLQMTSVVTDTLAAFSARYSIPLLPAIRVDATVAKAIRARSFLADFDPDCRAMHDYNACFHQLLGNMEVTRNGQATA